MLLDQDTPYGWRRRQARLVPEACELHLFKVACDADAMATELGPLRHRLLVCDATANGLKPGSFRVQARELAPPRKRAPDESLVSVLVFRAVPSKQVPDALLAAALWCKRIRAAIDAAALAKSLRGHEGPHVPAPRAGVVLMPVPGLARRLLRRTREVPRGLRSIGSR